MLEAVTLPILIVLIFAPTLYSILLGKKHRLTKLPAMSIIGKSFINGFIGAFLAFVATYIYSLFDAVQTCGAVDCIEKIDGPGPAGYLMMQGLLMDMAAASSFIVNFVLCCFLGFYRNFRYSRLHKV